MSPSLDYLYSLYDALISINVPNDKARAAVDAMERDMATTIATKADLQLLKQELTFDLQSLRQEVTSAIGELRYELRQEVALVRKDMEIMSNRFDSRIDGLSTTMTVPLGSMLMVGLGLLFAALKLT